MNGYEFCCWLRGVLDMNAGGLSSGQIAKIAEKLATVKSPEQLMAESMNSPQRPSGPVARC